ncbi:hypothetical protein Ahy_B06g083833 [Arachis hypogaea]|uniref:Ubiquitin-like protease family profile domain-containing protein n=1 Tax=Arachis hypogaea TaxID=3818 RepID=A0A444YQN7_ARAHY|nr:hypothetical protein Ahy_B06g083833 [Arachis hypogaea]
MANSSTSSTSQSHSEKKQPFYFRATFETQDIQLVANIRKLHQHTIELSIKNFQRKQSYNTQEKMAARNQPERNQTKDLKCATHLLSDKFRNMSEEKKTIVRDLGFGGLMHIPPLRVHHQVLRELANNFKLGENRLKTGYGSFKITPRKIGHALGINATVNYKKLSEDDKVIFRRFQSKTLKSLTDEMMDIGVDGVPFANDNKQNLACAPGPNFLDGQHNGAKLGRACFNLYHQGHNRLQGEKEEGNYSCLFALMIIYFHLSKNKGKKRAERPPKPWIANWSKEQLVERMNAETEEILRYEIGSEDLDELLRENNEKSAAERIPDVNLESDDPSSQGHTEQSSVNRPAESMLSLVQESASEPADSNIMVVREETPSEALVIVPIQVFVPVSQTTTVPEFEETPETDFEPTPLLQIEGTTKTTPEPPQQLEESTATLPPAPSKSTPEAPQKLEESTPVLPSAPSKSYPAEEDAAALMMMARTALYVPKTDPMPSFSLGFTDSSQEEAATQEGASTQEADKAKTPETANLLEQLEDLVQKIASSATKEESKSPQIQKETGGESSGKFETPAGINQNTGDMKEKCYIWVMRVKTYADDSTNEFDNLCTLIAQDKYILNRMHLASLQAGSYIESEIVSAMCLILNQKNDKRFREQVYCLPPDIVSMAVSKHPNGEFISPKTNKEFKVEDYPMFIPFIDGKKLASHRYIFAPVCYSVHWWLWVIDTTKERFYILDPLHKKAPSDERKQLNKFTGYVISRIRAYTGGEPLKKKENELEIKATYVKILGQKSSYDCAIYVMKWLELIEPENIKRAKYEWDNWPQEEVDYYRVEYASRILFSEINKERDQAIRASNAIRLSKPSSVLLSPFCQINSTDIETE